MGDHRTSPGVESPCTGVCRLNPASVCVGCGRHVGEIMEWLDADDARRREIRRAAARRLSIISGRRPPEATDDPTETQ